jgi:hypothetical protein
MTDTSSALRQKTWGKWFLIGMLGLVALAVIIAVVIKSKTAAWDNKSLSVAWSQATEGSTMEKTGEVESNGLFLKYALQNNTGHDITIPESVTIMTRLTKGGVLDSSSAKLNATTFVPAHDSALCMIYMEGVCDQRDFVTNKIVKTMNPQACYDQVFADSDGLVLFDHSNRIKITLPKPSFVKPK